LKVRYKLRALLPFVKQPVGTGSRLMKKQKKRRLGGYHTSSQEHLDFTIFLEAAK